MTFFGAAGVHVGSTRLSIIDLEGGAQPMAHPKGSLHISFNGECTQCRNLTWTGHHVFSSVDAWSHKTQVRDIGPTVRDELGP